MIPTKEENALINLIRAMNVQKVEPRRKITVTDIQLQVQKDWVFSKTKKNLC